MLSASILHAHTRLAGSRAVPAALSRLLHQQRRHSAISSSSTNGTPAPTSHADSYRIAIPSYDRAHTLQENTLRSLAAAGVDCRQRVDVFVNSQAEADTYTRVLAPGSVASINIGVCGIGKQRDFILDHYGAGQQVMMIDDDVEWFAHAYGPDTPGESDSDSNSDSDSEYDSAAWQPHPAAAAAAAAAHSTWQAHPSLQLQQRPPWDQGPLNHSLGAAPGLKLNSGLNPELDPELSVRLDLHAAILRGFALSRLHGCYMWGLNNVSNAYFMRQTYTVGWCFFQGPFMAFRVRDDMRLHPRYNEVKEDVQYSLMHCERDGRVLRLNGLGLKARPYRKEPGGLQTHFRHDPVRRRTEERTNQAYLAARYGKFIRDWSLGTPPPADAQQQP